MAALQKRAVAFVDILGFREHVRRIGMNPVRFHRLYQILRSTHKEETTLGKQRRSRPKNPGYAFHPPRDFQFTAFSDCIVLSTPTRYALALVLIAHDLASRLLTKGFLSRGAIVEGAAYHDRRILLGPAVVQAYDFEANVAKYPRIILADALGQRIRQDHWKHYGWALSRDADGCYFVDVFTRWQVDFDADDDVDEFRLQGQFFRAVRRQLVGMLERTKRLDHLSKVRWLALRFNLSLRDLNDSYETWHKSTSRGKETGLGIPELEGPHTA